MGRLAEFNKVREDAVLISETDHLGIILHANDAFCAISGYSREELVGNSHNIVRHPSMPGKLFRHLWSTIKSGNVFRGVIKNQAKDGTYYWVNCTMIPVFEKREIVRYLSARRLITDEKLAEELFAKQVAAIQAV